MEFELSEIVDFHEGKVAEWWKDVISSAELMLDDQKETLKKLQKG
jgi:hypothetical protein